MKKSLSLLLAIVMAFSMFASVAFAAEDTTSTSTEVTSTENTATEPEAPAAELTTEQKFEALKALGIFEGDQNGEAGLDQDMTRGQFAKIVALLTGQTIDESATSDFKDVIATNHWAGKYIAAVSTATPVLMNGVGQGNFDPEGKVSLQMLATVLVRALGIPTDPTVEVEGAHDWAWQYVDAAVKAGLIPASSDYTANALRGQLVESSYEAVQVIELGEAAKTATYKIIDSKNVEVTVGEDVIKVTLETALEPNKTTTITVPYKGRSFELSVTYTITSVDLKSAVALNSKVIEVALNTATTAVDGSAFKVADKDGKDVAVTGAEIAPWSADGKSVLVTLGVDTVAGDLYKLTSGEKSVNFAGRAADSAKPVANEIRSTDYNQALIVFDEAVRIKDLTVAIAETYASSKALEVKEIKYKSSNEILVTTGDQTDATLYTAKIAGAVDLAGNTADSTDLQFAGTAKNTDELSAQTAYANDHKTVLVKFNTKVDPATIAGGTFEVTDEYDSSKKLAVASAKLATSDDLEDVGVKIGDAYETAVVLTMKDGLEEAVLYKVTFNNLKTLYGKGTNASSNSTYFNGVGPIESLNLVGAESANNTTVKLEFNGKVDTAEGAVVSNYKVTETYNSSASLAVKSATVSGNTVTLTVDKQKDALYTVKVSNLKDIYGIKLGEDNSEDFVGELVADAISSIVTAELGSDATILELTFDKKVGDSAKDIAHYSINNSIGYPIKVTSVDGAVVKLQIPATQPGKLYTVTVKGLENSDGVAMGSDGVSAQFVGRGASVSVASLKGASAKDNKTLALYFDKAAKDVAIWNKDNHVLNADVQITVRDTNNNPSTVVVNVDTDNAYVWVDPNNENVLLLRGDTADVYKKSADGSKPYEVEISGLAITDSVVKANNRKAKFAYNEKDPEGVVVKSVVALNEQTIRVTFNQPVRIADLDAAIYTNASGTGTAIDLDQAIAIDSTDTVFDISLDDTFTANTSYYLIAIDAADITGKVGLKGENDTTQQVRRFAGSTKVVGSITNVPVQMTDARTLIVFYPEKMAGNAATPGNYVIYGVRKDGTGDDELSAGKIATTAHDASKNQVTLTLNANLTADLADYKSFYVQIDTSVSNAIGTRFVEKDGSNVKAPFAYNAKAAAKVTVVSATYQGLSGGNDVIKIELSQAVNATAFVGLDESNIKVFVNGSTSALDNSKFSVRVVPGDVTGGFTKIFYIDVNPGEITNANRAGKVTLNSDTVFTGINGMGTSKGSSASFSQKL